LLFLLAILAVSILSGATAAVSGFGIGSLLTPLLATRMDMQVAVAAVAIPHALATAVRAWRLRTHVDLGILRSFGVWSALGGLTGALLYSRSGSRTLTLILALLLLLTAVAGLTDWMRRVRPAGPVVGLLGVASGLFGGVAGNQGGLRSAALMSFGLAPLAFVATATASGLIVDAARLPVYLWRAGSEIVPLATPLAVASVGVLVGTVLGERILLGMERDRFRRVISALIGLLGMWLLAGLAR
jgi:uncharacterized protein